MASDVTQPPALPDNVVEAVRQAMSDADGHQWRVGDLLVGIVDELEGGYSRAGVKYARAWLIRNLASRTGSDASTLRDREVMARFYPPTMRAEYDALTYHQLRACKSAGPERWREYADWALANLPAPVAVIRAKVKNGGHLPPAWEGRWQRVQEIAAEVAADHGAAREVRAMCRVLAYIGPS